jgi:hypothetical protein
VFRDVLCDVCLAEVASMRGGLLAFHLEKLSPEVCILSIHPAGGKACSSRQIGQIPGTNGSENLATDSLAESKGWCCRHLLKDDQSNRWIYKISDLGRTLGTRFSPPRPKGKTKE